MTIALSISDVAFVPQPPHRPPRPARRSGGSVVAALIRSFRRELAHAADEPAAAWLPKLSRYPY